MDAELLKENTQKMENCQSSSDLDPFMTLVVFLQEAQEALEKEIKKLGEIEKEEDDNDGQFEVVESGRSLIPEVQLFELNKKVKHLESKLQETLATVKTKEQKVWELELLLSNTNFPKVQGTSTHVSALQEGKEEVKYELEVLLMKKMEAEIEYLILRRTSPNWKILSEDHIALLNDLRYLAGNQEQMMLKLRDAEDKTIKLSERTDKLWAYSNKLVRTENVLRLQHIVYDLLAIGRADHSTTITLKTNLLILAQSMELEVNLLKSEVCLSKLVANSDELTNKLGLQIGKFLFKYLGLPLTAWKLTAKDCSSLLEKIQNWMAGWKHKFLSLGGRFQLIRCSINNYLSY